MALFKLGVSGLYLDLGQLFFFIPVAALFSGHQSVVTFNLVTVENRY